MQPAPQAAALAPPTDEHLPLPHWLSLVQRHVWPAAVQLLVDAAPAQSPTVHAYPVEAGIVAQSWASAVAPAGRLASQLPPQAAELAPETARQ